MTTLILFLFNKKLSFKNISPHQTFGPFSSCDNFYFKKIAQKVTFWEKTKTSVLIRVIEGQNLLKLHFLPHSMVVESIMLWIQAVEE